MIRMQSKHIARLSTKSALFLATAVACLAWDKPGAMAGSLVSVASDAPAAPRGGTLLGATPAGQPITVALTLPSRDPAGAAAFVAAVGKPGNALYHRYLSPAEYAARFGASGADYTALAGWAHAHGMAPGEIYAARTVLPVTGTAASLGAALGVTFNTYRKASGETYYAADRAPRVPVDIAQRISGVVGLSSAGHFKPLLRRLAVGAHPRLSGTGPGGGFSAADLRDIYNVQPQCCAQKPQTVAVFEQGGFARADITAYQQKMGIPAVKVTARAVDGYTLAINDPDVELEAVLDVDMALAVNPAIKRVLVYEDGTDSFPVALLDSLSAMATDKAAQIISISYGQDEALQGGAAIAAENTVLTQLAAQGQAVFASAGDSGAYGDEPPALNVADPASQPMVTAVGGTTLFTGPGETYGGEETWNDIGLGLGATGGGVSAVWQIPSYQLAFGSSVAVSNGGSSTYRNVPDVAAVANPESGVAVYSRLNGGWVVVGGTSVGAPLWAGFYSLANAASEAFGQGTLGFANTIIYDLSNGGQTNYPDFNDVQDGSNGNANVYDGQGGFSAGPYYDNVTGWGSLDANHLLQDIVLYPANSGFKTPPLPSQLKATSVTPTSITLSWVPAPGTRNFDVVGSVRTPVESQFSATTTATITGLKPHTYYELFVWPFTKNGINRSGPGIFVSTAAN
jgi:kumamolisin